MRKATEYHNTTLQTILHKTKQLHNLQQNIDRYLPTDLKAYCSVANYCEGHLVLVAENAAWAMHIRYQTPELLKHLRDDPLFAQLRQITVKVQRTAPEPPKQSLPVEPLSPQSRNVLEETAAQIDDPDLKAALLRLAQTPP